jgi:flagellar basal-body rod protein FlgF
MDKALFIDSTGAKTSMHQLELLTNNLANANTTGFRADLESLKQSKNDPKSTRVYSSLDKTYTDFTHGPAIRTDRDLDIAMANEGFIAVKSKSGKEGYTRSGELQRTPEGLITTKTGEVVMGVNGIIDTPQDTRRVSIAEDGTVTVLLKGQDLPVTLNRIKLTNPAVDQLRKGEDGLFYMVDESPVRFDEKIRVIPGSLEGSNVNPVQALTTLIELSREFEMHTNFMKTLETQAGKSNQILEMPR